MNCASVDSYHSLCTGNVADVSSGLEARNDSEI